VRAFPLRISNVRADALNEVSLSVLKRTRITEGTNLQFKAEALNLFNHPVLRAPSTTVMASSFSSTVGANQVNYARCIQLSVKFVF
jgi:hypothetical protein